MIRTQIQLTEVQAETMKRLAIRQRTSMAALIRQAIDQMLYHGPDKERQADFAKALNAAGKFHSGQHDLSVNHNQYLSEAFKS